MEAPLNGRDCGRACLGSYNPALVLEAPIGLMNKDSISLGAALRTVMALVRRLDLPGAGLASPRANGKKKIGPSTYSPLNVVLGCHSSDFAPAHVYMCRDLSTHAGCHEREREKRSLFAVLNAFINSQTSACKDAVATSSQSVQID